MIFTDLYKIKEVYSKMKQETKKFVITLLKGIAMFLTATAVALGTMWGLSSCSVKRVVSTTAESYQKGDTSVVIQTKTVESYTATKQQ